MFATCTHTHPSGTTCQSPAVRGTNLCFQHTPHEPINRRQPNDYQAFELPPINSKCGVITAITVVLDQLSMRRIKRSEADTFIRGFSLLTRLMTEEDQLAAAEMMQMNPVQPAAPPQEEVTPESLQKQLDELAEGLGIEMPSLEEMHRLQASMPNGSPKKALEHWIATGRIRPRQSATGPQPHWKMRENSPLRDRPRIPQCMSDRPRPSMQPPDRESVGPVNEGESIQIAANAPAPSASSIHP